MLHQAEAAYARKPHLLKRKEEEEAEEEEEEAT